MGQRLFFSIVLCFLLVCGSVSFAGKPCESVLSHNRNSTEDLIVYLQVLIEERVLEKPDFERFISGLEKGKLENLISQEQAQSTIYLVHRQGLAEHFQQPDLDMSKLLKWALKTQQDLERAQEVREETQVETKELHQKMVFHRVEPGTFTMGEGDKTVQVILTHPIEVMSTLITQKHWVDVMGENPSRYFQEGEDSVTLTIQEKQVKLQPDHPVENVTWWSMIVFANKLSVLHGYEPAYDLSDLKIKSGTRAEDGTLKVESGELRINADKGIIYHASGYRLPTEAEQEYLLRAGGKAMGEYPFPKEELKDYAWYNENSNGSTHVVAELKPVYINGKAFYDLQGNVLEWGQDWHWEDSQKSVKNPQGSQKKSFRSVRGGCCGLEAHYASSARRSNTQLEKQSSFIGGRLVRTITPNPSFSRTLGEFFRGIGHTFKNFALKAKLK